MLVAGAAKVGMEKLIVKYRYTTADTGETKEAKATVRDLMRKKK